MRDPGSAHLAPASEQTAIIDLICELQVRRKHWIRAANKLTNSIGALTRRHMGWTLALPEKERKKIEPRAAALIKAVKQTGAFSDGERGLPESLLIDLGATFAALAPVEAERERIERQMRKLVKQFAVWQSFAEGVAGFGELGLAVIIGEAGDLAGYPNPDKLKKRLGLAPFRGAAASTWRKKGGLTADDWTEVGYSPRRRAEIYAVIGVPLFRAQSVAAKRDGGGQASTGARKNHAAPYRTIYDARRAHTAVTHPDWIKGHSHNDALRIMTQQLVIDLWCAWNGKERKPTDNP